MNIIVGATGQVGSNLIKEIIANGLPARAVIRDAGKLPQKNIEVRTADLFNPEQLTEAFKGGTTVFLLTPENPASNDILGDTKQIVENYRKAIQATGIKKIVGLSSIGAQNDGNTGNLLMSKILEQGFDDLEATKIFIRPSYYFSNWLVYLETVKQFGVLPTFFQEDLRLDMNSPVDVAKFIAKVITGSSTSGNKDIYELVGPRKYSSLDVATTFSKLLNKDVTVQCIPKQQWKETFMSVGFTENTATNLSDTTQAVIDNKTVPERPIDAIKLPTTLEEYIDEQLKKQTTTR